ncbi:MAG: phosphatidylserine decarboxylase family protein, partial [Alphaproteobacteria bacterium]|nr:phosphatidylserine decarboxylase family protein [Alphaproteobacteria bacterium]
MLSNFLVPLHRDGWKFVVLFFVVTVLLGSLVWSWLWLVGLLATAWCIFFFRDPPRVTPQRAGLVVSPADGLVSQVGAAVPPAELDLGGEALPRISIFLSVFDVHVNRVPAEGVIDVVAYHPGRFLSAADDKASDENERQAMAMTLPDGRRLAFVQIAGLVARRILCELKPQQSVRAGERFGLIRFGSRTDVYLPPGSAPLVAV